MFPVLKSFLMIVVCAAVVLQLAGCIFVRHDRRADRDRPRVHDEDKGHPDIDIRVHGP